MKSEELYLAASNIFGEYNLHLLIEVKGSTSINLDDILRTRYLLEPKVYFTESEVLYLFKRFVDTL